MRVTWDDRKATANLRKHSVSFEEATTALADPLAITGRRPRPLDRRNALDRLRPFEPWAPPRPSPPTRTISFESSAHGRRPAQNVGFMKKA